MASFLNYYDTNYADFAASIHADIRQKVFGKDIGQNSWTTADELREFAELAGLTRQTRLLEVACGAGGPALHLAETFGLHVIGLDINEAAIAAANATTVAKGLSGRATFLRADANETLPFDDQTFDAVQCIDSINHLSDRGAVIGELRRVLRPGGMLLYTDPIIVTGAVTNAEIAARASIGFFLFVAPGENERALRAAGFDLIRQMDVTENEALTSSRWIAAREAKREDLLRIEGADTFDGMQRFFRTVHLLSRERRLSRQMFLARRTAS